LASNTTPSPCVVHELTEVMAKVSQLSTERQHKHTSQEELLDIVLRLSRKRVLGRLRPSWIRPPPHIRTQQPSLQDQIRKYTEELQKTLQRTPQITQLLERLSALVEALR
ncbi:hypothetical protein EDB81DRAFT_614942, partial [Dactylonectria macrodidyma]